MLVPYVVARSETSSWKGGTVAETKRMETSDSRRSSLILWEEKGLTLKRVHWLSFLVGCLPRVHL